MIWILFDFKLQKMVYILMRENGYFLGMDQVVEGSVVFIDNKIGGVCVVVGGCDYVIKGYNRVIVLWQLGLMFKLFVVYGFVMQEDKFKLYLFF